MILLIVAFGAYFLLLVLLIIGWRIAVKRKFPAVQPGRNFKITVVVPFRNEEQNLPDILQDLKRQNYDKNCFEVVLCNDHSTDKSARVVNDAILKFGNFKLISCTGEGKKRALSFAIENASGEIIVTTDADCRVPENWLSRINHSFQSPTTKMVSGGMKIQEDGTFFSQLQSMEYSSLIGSGAATLSLGFPTMCNGANLVFLKSAFDDVGGYEGNIHIPSGDDEFLMRKINKKFPGSIYFMNASDSVVSTQPQSTLKEFVHQRLRWAGKWRHSSSGVSVTLAIFVLICQVSFISLLILTFTNSRFLPIGLFLMGMKFVFEGLFLFQVGSFLRIRWNWTSFLVLQLFYPLYVIWIGLAANFRSYQWKERKHNVF